MFHALAFCAGVILPVALQKIDSAPDAEASAQRDNKGLQNVNSTIKEIHYFTSKIEIVFVME